MLIHVIKVIAKPTNTNFINLGRKLSKEKIKVAEAQIIVEMIVIIDI